jgi:hypothetical protein
LTRPTGFEKHNTGLSKRGKTLKEEAHHFIWYGDETGIMELMDKRRQGQVKVRSKAKAQLGWGRDHGKKPCSLCI